MFSRTPSRDSLPHHLRATLVALVPAFALLACTGSSSTTVSDGGPTGDGGGLGGSGGVVGNGGSGGVVGNGGAGGRSDAAQLGGGGSGGGGPLPGLDAGPADPNEVMYCNKVSKVACDKFMACNPAVLKALFGDIANCQARFALDCADSQPIPMATQMPAQLDGCVAAQAAQSCDDLANGVALPACDLKGPLPNGDACVDSRQCSSGNCVFSANSLCGTCSIYTPEGGTCTADITNCAPGLDCIATGAGATTGLCTKKAAVGGNCMRADCVAGAYCTAAGTCAAQLAAGAACDPMNDGCPPSKELVCDPTTLKCVPFTYVGVNAVCNDTAICMKSVCRVAAQGATSGMCVDRLADGAQCVSRLQCQTPATCAVVVAPPAGTQPDHGNCVFIPPPRCE